MQILKSDLKHIFHKILVIDIETVSMFSSFDELDENYKKHWFNKAVNIKKYTDSTLDDETLFKDRAGIFSEFGKIICISMGYFNSDGDTIKLRIKTLKNDDEYQLLESFNNIINQFELKHKSIVFCGHNIKEFDLPYLCRRMIVHGIDLPVSLQLSGIKSWNHPHLDTLDMWRFGDYKHYVSLDLLASVFGVESSKTDMDGSQVSKAYWAEHRLEDIGNYCSRDVLTTANVLLKIKNENVVITPEFIE